jgi:hypothetical protein
VEEAIAGRIVENQHLSDAEVKTLTVEELLKNVSFQELCDFVIRQARYNTDLANAVKLEFAHKLINVSAGEDINPYSSIIRDILEDVEFDSDEYYEYEGTLELNDLYQWLEKARNYVGQHNYNEAVLICKACIEEFAEWMHDAETEIVDLIDTSYQTVPFELMEQSVTNANMDYKALYGYCLSEMNRNKYANTEMFDKFNDLLATLAVKINSDEFIALQDNLLEKIEDKSSHEAEKILRREINFYCNIRQSEKANAILEKNIQIENFRYQVVEKLFAGQNYAGAKKLIEDLIQEKRDIGRDYAGRWDELLLEIALKENDNPSIQTIAFSFIAKMFNEKYYYVYKSTFTSKEWRSALENLLQHYEKNTRDFDFRKLRTSNFSSSVADVLVTEGAAERLLDYIEQNLSVERMEKYYTAFVDLYPEKTLELFKKAIDDYAANVGRNYYEHTAKLLEQMLKIKNGKKMVSEMVANYRVKYKNRRVMMEVLSSF